MSRKILTFLVSLALVVTVLRVNYKEIVFAAFRVYYTMEQMFTRTPEVSGEQILEIGTMGNAEVVKLP